MDKEQEIGLPLRVLLLWCVPRIAISFIIFLFVSIPLSCGIATASMTGLGHRGNDPFAGFGVFLLLIIMALFIYSIALPGIYWASAKIVISDSRIKLSVGFFTKKIVDIDYGKARVVEITQSFFQRIMGLAVIRFNESDYDDFFGEKRGFALDKKDAFWLKDLFKGDLG